MTSKTEAVGTSLQRLTTWTYGNSSFPGLLTQIVMPSTSGGTAQRVTILSYTPRGTLPTRTSKEAEAGTTSTSPTTTTFTASGHPSPTTPPGTTRTNPPPK